MQMNLILHGMPQPISTKPYLKGSVATLLVDAIADLFAR
jgi:hypothetical protein